MDDFENSEKYLNEGIIFLEDGQLRLAFEAFTKAIELNPKNSAAFSRRGEMNLYDLKNYVAAIKDFSSEIKIEPNNEFAYIDRGKSYAKFNKHENAIKDFTKAIKINPNSLEAYKLRGISYDLNNESSKAFNDYKVAAKLGDKECLNWIEEFKPKRLNEYSDIDFASMSNIELKEIFLNEIEILQSEPLDKNKKKTIEDLKDQIFEMENGIFINHYKKSYESKKILQKNQKTNSNNKKNINKNNSDSSTDLVEYLKEKDRKAENKKLIQGFSQFIGIVVVGYFVMNFAINILSDFNDNKKNIAEKESKSYPKQDKYLGAEDYSKAYKEQEIKRENTDKKCMEYWNNANVFNPSYSYREKYHVSRDNIVTKISVSKDPPTQTKIISCRIDFQKKLDTKYSINRGSTEIYTNENGELIRYVDRGSLGVDRYNLSTKDGSLIENFDGFFDLLTD